MTQVKRAPDIERMKEVVLDPKKYIRHCTSENGENAYMILTDHDSMLRHFGEVMLGKSRYLRFWRDGDKVYVAQSNIPEYVILPASQKTAGFNASWDDNKTLGEWLPEEGVLYVSDPGTHHSYRFYLVRD